MTTPTNDAIGRVIGVTHATVSRYRSGDRCPELDTMGVIAREFAWSIDDQYEARTNGRYADEFDKRVVSVLARRTMGEDATPDQQGATGETAPHTPAA